MRMTVTAYMSEGSSETSEGSDHTLEEISAERIVAAVESSVQGVLVRPHLVVVEGLPAAAVDSRLLFEIAPLVGEGAGSVLCRDREGDSLSGVTRAASSSWVEAPRCGLFDSEPGVSVGEGIVHALAHSDPGDGRVKHLLAALEDGTLLSIRTSSEIFPADAFLHGAGGSLVFDGSGWGRAKYSVALPHGDLWVETIESEGGEEHEERLHVASLPPDEDLAARARRVLSALAGGPLSRATGLGDLDGMCRAESRAAALIAAGAYAGCTDLLPEQATTRTCSRCGRSETPEPLPDGSSSLRVDLPHPYPARVALDLPAADEDGVVAGGWLCGDYHVSYTGYRGDYGRVRGCGTAEPKAPVSRRRRWSLWPQRSSSGGVE